MSGENRLGLRTSTVYRIGTVAALLQLVVIASFGVITALFGLRPDSISETYELFTSSPLRAFLTGDLFLVLLVSLYLGTFPALYTALKQEAPLISLVTLSATVVGVLIGYANESTFALWHLAKQYAAAATDLEHQALIAAGEAVVAAGWWKSTDSYLSGILLQGSGVVISIVMLKSRRFSKWTAWTGLIGNGLDLIQHLFEPFTPGINETLAPFMGPFYLAWFPLLARDFARLRKDELKE